MLLRHSNRRNQLLDGFHLEPPPRRWLRQRLEPGLLEDEVVTDDTPLYTAPLVISTVHFSWDDQSTGSNRRTEHRPNALTPHQGVLPSIFYGRDPATIAIGLLRA